ncbi:hypothetical protein NPIL_575141 [Nephila pilipes]|uniref:Uncharacterized protein n=1 Tax=Nephila pilipes TaxID=299642 RepID=A0A8X6UFG6_NEPPI|nr:hypothetical protein NPIL_575141 [Nephila pilipes]
MCCPHYCKQQLHILSQKPVSSKICYVCLKRLQNQNNKQLLFDLYSTGMGQNILQEAKEIPLHLPKVSNKNENQW